MSRLHLTDGDTAALAAFRAGKAYETNWRFKFWGDLSDVDRANALAAGQIGAASPSPDPADEPDPIARLVQRYKGGISATTAAPPADTSVYANEIDSQTGRFAGPWRPYDAVLKEHPHLLVSGPVLAALLRGSEESEDSARGDAQASFGDRRFPAGVRLAGVVVRGEIDLEAAGAGHPMEAAPFHMVNCVVEQRLQLSQATLGELELTKSIVAGVAAAGVRIRRDVRCPGMVLKGHSVNFSGAEISGDCDFSEITAQPGEVLVLVDLSRARIAGSLLLPQAGRRTLAPMQATAGEASVASDPKMASKHGLRGGLKLTATNARVAGSLMLERAFIQSADLSFVQVGGRVYAADARIYQSFELRSANVSGSFSLQRACAWSASEECRIDLSETQIDGEANLHQLGWPNASGGNSRAEYKPVLVGEGLKVQGKVTLSAARLRSLDFKGAKFNSAFEAWSLEVSRGKMTRDEVRNANSRGELDQLKITEDSPSALQARADFFGATILGEFDLLDALILAPLVLEGATIEGDALFGGAILGDGARAIVAKDARMGRSILLGTIDNYVGLITLGNIDCERARIRGSLVLTGATLYCGKASGLALSLDDAAIEGSLHLLGFYLPVNTDGGRDSQSARKQIKSILHGRVDLVRCRIGGGLTFAGAEVITPGGLAVYGPELTVKGGISIRTTPAPGNPEPKSEARLNVEKFDIETSDVRLDTSGAGSTRAHEGAAPRDELQGLKAIGCIDFHQSQIDGDVDFEGSSFTASVGKDAGGWRGYALNLRDARINGRLFLRASRGEKNDDSRRRPFECTGLINLNGAHILCGLDFGGGRFKSMPTLEEAPDPRDRPGTAVDATGTRIGGSVFFRRYADPGGKDAEFEGAVDFDRAEIFGDVRIGAAKFQPASYDPEQSRREDPKTDLILSLRNAVIHGDLRIRSVKERKGLVDLTGARMRALDDNGGDGWGERPVLKPEGEKLDRGVRLRLDGCTYERFVPKQGGAKSQIVGDRRPWLMRQYPPRTEQACEGTEKKPFKRVSWTGREKLSRNTFNMEPFESAARVLMRGGYQVQARQVSAAGMKAERISGSLGGPIWPQRIMSKLQSALFFSYGYEPSRAVWIGVLILITGWMSAWIQMSAGRLVDTASLQVEQARPCRAAPLVYAMDAMLLGIDLGPEQECSLAQAGRGAAPDYSLGLGSYMSEGAQAWLRQEVAEPIVNLLDTPVQSGPLELLRDLWQALVAGPQALSFWGSLYSLFSSIFLFVAALTFTGVLRRDRQSG